MRISDWSSDVCSSDLLTSEERLFAIKTAGPRLTRSRALAWAALLREDWIVRDEFLTIDLLPFVKGTSERLDDLAAARAIVWTSDAIGRASCRERGCQYV